VSSILGILLIRGTIVGNPISLYSPKIYKIIFYFSQGAGSGEDKVPSDFQPDEGMDQQGIKNSTFSM